MYPPLGLLFGVKKGSYTGAERDRIALVEKTNHGIMFLDEVHRFVIAFTIKYYIQCF